MAKKGLKIMFSVTKKGMYFILGTALISIGAIGLAAPVLPGIPFMLFGLTFYAKTFNSFDAWLVKRDLKPYLNFIYFMKAVYCMIRNFITRYIGEKIKHTIN